MINVLSAEAIAFGEEFVAYLEDNDYRSFDGGEQEDRQNLVMSWASRVQNLITGTPPVMLKEAKTFKATVVLLRGSAPWAAEAQPGFCIEFDNVKVNRESGFIIFSLNEDPVFATDPNRISYIEYKKN